MSDILRNRIKSEARAGRPIRNEDLVCRDCIFRFDDSKIFGNTSKCDVYPDHTDCKPNDVLVGGSCECYEKEE